MLVDIKYLLIWKVLHFKIVRAVGKKIHFRLSKWLEYKKISEFLVNSIRGKGLCVKQYIKVKLSLCSTNKALCYEGVWGSGYIDPYFLDFGTIWR
jgi:hypothetical protein